MRIKLVDLLDHSDPLFQLTGTINWTHLETIANLNQSLTRPGRPAISARLMIGLHLLKYLENKSDEAAVKAFLHNPYWQHFCGCEYFEHEVPLNSSTMTKWRKKIGIPKLERVLEETLNAAKREGLLVDRELQAINVDTTVQEKAISFPTDSRLYHRMRRKLVKDAKKRNIELRQSYERVGQKSFIQQARYAHARQMKRAKKQVKKLKNYLGRVIRDIERKADVIDDKLLERLNLAKRLLLQQRKDKKKLYSLHAPEVECISKGKVHKKYEFGCKVSIATTAHTNWVVGAMAVHGNPYDGHTLKASVDQVERLTHQRPLKANVDQGYRGKSNHPDDIEIFISGSRSKKIQSVRRFMKRRSAIEPVIGHMKTDHRMGRNFLLGQIGDHTNVLLSACAFNLKKIMNCFMEQKTRCVA